MSLSMLYWVMTKKYNLSWRMLFQSIGFNFIWPTLLGIILLCYFVNSTLGVEQWHSFRSFYWIIWMYCFARMIPLAKFPAWTMKASCLFVTILCISLTAHYFLFPPDDPTVWGMPNRLRGTFTNTNYWPKATF